MAQRPARFVLLILVSLILGGLFVGNFMLGRGFWAARIEAAVRSRLVGATGAEVSFSRARLHLLPSWVDLEGVRIPPAVTVKKIRIRFSSWSLLMQAFVIKRIALEEPTVEIGADAKIPMVSAVKPSPGTGGGGGEGGGGKVIVREIDIIDGALRYRGAAPLKSATLAGVSGSVQPDLRMRQFFVTAKIGHWSAAVVLPSGAGRTLEGSGEIKGSFDPEEVEIRSATLSSDNLLLHAEGTFRPSGGTLDGRVELSAPLSTITALPDLAGNLFANIKLSGDVHEPTASGLLKIENLALRGGAPASLSADFSYTAGLLKFEKVGGGLFAGQVEGSGDWRPANGDFSASLWASDLRLEQISIFLPPLPFSEGSVALKGNFSRSGEVLSGAADFSLLPSTAPEHPETLQSAVKKISGGLSLAEGRLTIPDGVIEFMGGAGHASAQIDVASGRIIAAVRIRADDLSTVARRMEVPVAGRMEARGVVIGALKSQPAGQSPWGLWGTVEGDGLAYRGERLGRLKAFVTYNGEKILVKNGELREDQTAFAVPGTYRFTGEIGQSYRASIRLAGVHPDQGIRILWHDLPLSTTASGRIDLKGKIGKDGKHRFSAEGDLKADSGSLFEVPFDRGEALFRIDEKGIRFSRLLAVSNGATAAGSGEILYPDRFSLSLFAKDLPLERFPLLRERIPLLTAQASAEISGSGTFAQPQIRFDVAFSSLQYGETDLGGGEIKGEVLPSRRILFSADFPRNDLHLAADTGIAPPYPFALYAVLRDLRIDPLFFPRDRKNPLSRLALIASGEIRAEGEIQHPEKITGAFLLPAMVAETDRFRLTNEGPLSVRSEGGKVLIDSFRLVGEQTSLSATGELTLGSSFDLLLNGESDLSILGQLTREIETGKGRISIALKIKDRWDDPKIEGGITVQNGTVKSRTIAQPVGIRSLQIFFNERQVVLENFLAESGRGKIEGSGAARLRNFSLKDFNFLFNFSEIKANLMEGMTAVLEGNLALVGDGERREIKGEAQLKKGVYDRRIDLKTLLLEFRRKSEARLAREIPMFGATRLSFRLYGKDNVWIANNLAQAPLDVDLLVKGTVERPLFIGRVELTGGTLLFRRNTFAITRGTIEFFNPDRIAPVFDIRASSKIREYDVDFSMAGTLDHFNLALTSLPPLPEPDILTLLAVGRTTEEIAQAQKSGVGGEAASIAFEEFLEEPIQKLTGIDRLQIEPYACGSSSETASGTRLIVGKRLLNDRITVLYCTATAASEDQLIRMEFTINKNLSLVGERDENGRLGGDIKIRFEVR